MPGCDDYMAKMQADARCLGFGAHEVAMFAACIEAMSSPAEIKGGEACVAVGRSLDFSVLSFDGSTRAH